MYKVYCSPLSTERSNWAPLSHTDAVLQIFSFLLAFHLIHLVAVPPPSLSPSAMASPLISKPKKLKKISDRKIHIPTAGPVASPPSPPDSSLFSKEPASPTPSSFAPPPLTASIPKCLGRYPSLVHIIAKLREVSETTQSASDFEAYAVIFCTSLSTNVLCSLERTVHLDTSDPKYCATYYDVVDSADHFRSWACKKVEGEDQLGTSMRLATSMFWFNATLKALRELHKLVVRMVGNAKPLPGLPLGLSREDDVAKIPSADQSGDLGSHKPRSPKLRISPLSIIVEEVLNEDTPSSPGSPNDTAVGRSTSSLGHLPPIDEPSSSTDTLVSNPPDKAGFPARRKKLAQQIRRVYKLAKERGHRLVPTKASVSTLTSEPTFESFKSFDRPQVVQITYAIRQSALYHFEDPMNRVDMPMPEDYAAMQVDEKGQLTSATLRALILQITSREVTQEGVLDTFFLGFRYFTTPVILARGLLDRLEGMDDHEYEFTEQQRIVWAASKDLTEQRVVYVICLWLERYWNSTLDNEALEIFQRYVLSHPDCRPGSEMVVLYKCLNQVGSGSASRSKWLERRSREIAGESLYPKPKDTNFRFSSVPDKTVPSRLRWFMTEAGVQEFARQLTIQSSSLFRNIDPEGSVRSWIVSESEGRETRADFVNWGRSLTFWATISILQQPTVDDRVLFIEFWLDVAMTCLKHYDFNSAFAIYNGVVASPVNRLRRTALRLSVREKGYHWVFEKVFDNFKEYRRIVQAVALESRPMVPILDPLVHDVSQVKTSLSKAMTEGRINFFPIRTICATIQTMEQARLPYVFKNSAACQEWLTLKLRWAVNTKAKLDIDDVDQYQMSRSLEPRDPELEKIHSNPAMLWNLVATSNGYESVDSITKFDLDAIFNIRRI
ncbi:ras guanine nucleotide exchange factor domain-containing protein [Armillaria fumosa]|nr:ras guanine nucleotide exchange factor domain-containing protein [Armillaria fumosa]